MPFDGSGGFDLVAGNPVVTGTTISSTVNNNTNNDYATGFETCLTIDGQTVPTANIPMGGFRITGLGNGTVVTDAARVSQVQNQAFNTLSSVGGTATAITATATPTPAAIVTGQLFRGIAAATNTGGTTLNISSLGPYPIHLGGSALLGGEIVINRPFEVMADTSASCMHLLETGAPIAPAVSGSSQGLACLRASASTIDIDANEILLKNTNGSGFIASAVNLTVDITASGANGLDTGAEAGNTWYYGWVIATPGGTVAGLLSASSTSPTMPAGYTYKALVTAVRNDGSSNFIAYNQRGNEAYFQARQIVLNGGQQTSETQITISSFVPPIADNFQISGQLGAVADAGVTGGVSLLVRFVTGVDYSSLCACRQGAVAGQDEITAGMGTLPNVSQTLYYLISRTSTGGTTPNASVWINSFSVPVGQ